MIGTNSQRWSAVNPVCQISEKHKTVILVKLSYLWILNRPSSVTWLVSAVGHHVQVKDDRDDTVTCDMLLLDQSEASITVSWPMRDQDGDGWHMTDDEGGGRGWNEISLVDTAQANDGAQPISGQHPENWPIRGPGTLLISDTSSRRKHGEEDLSIWINLNSCQPPFPLSVHQGRCVVIVWTQRIGLSWAQVFLTHQELSRLIILLIKIQMWSELWWPAPGRGPDNGQQCQLQDTQWVSFGSGGPGGSWEITSVHRLTGSYSEWILGVS